MTVIDVEEKSGAWFDMEGGGRVQLRVLTVEDFKKIRAQTVTKKVDFKRVEGKAERFEYEQVNEDLQNELSLDACIVSWEKLFDAAGNEIPCTKENKVLLMTRSAKFAKFIAESLAVLTESENEQAQAAEKN